MQEIDGRVRRRLRALILAHWKKRPTIARNLIKGGAKRHEAWAAVYGGRHGLWYLSHTPAVEKALSNRFFAAKGLVSLAQMWRGYQKAVAQPAIALVGQLTLFPGGRRS